MYVYTTGNTPTLIEALNETGKTYSSGAHTNNTSQNRRSFQNGWIEGFLYGGSDLQFISSKSNIANNSTQNVS